MRVRNVGVSFDWASSPVLPAARLHQAVLAASIDLAKGHDEELVDAILAAPVECRQSPGVHGGEVVAPIALPRHAVGEHFGFSLPLPG